MTPPEHLHPGPAEYVAGPGALAALGEITARFGPKTLVIHGEHGYATVPDGRSRVLENLRFITAARHEIVGS